MDPLIHWSEGGQARTARWRSEAGVPPPKQVEVGDDRMSADAAFRLIRAGASILWRGDYHNARQLMSALARRVDRPSRAPGSNRPPAGAETSLPRAFELTRRAQARRAELLGRLLLPYDAGYVIPLRRAPDIRQACREAYGEDDAPFVASLREQLGIIGAHEWRKKGVEIVALGARIHPHYGVFAPIRQEYVDLVARAPLPSKALAFDIGTGTGVLAAVFAKRGVIKVIATDDDPRALDCAAENIARLKLADRVEVVRADLFPPGRAPLVVCNPPWVPATPSSRLERAVYDPESRMLRGFLAGVAAHLTTDGEGWLILSDLAEHLGLREREDLLGWIDQAGLSVVDRLDAKPAHKRAADTDDPLHAARAAEVTSLWRLAQRGKPRMTRPEAS